MESWHKITATLCLFGFLKEIRPIELFMYDYLQDPLGWNLTSQQIQQDVFPIVTYSYLAQSVVVFLLTDSYRYKPLITLLGISGAVSYGITLWETTILGAHLMSVLYGTMMATEVAYYTYIYAKVSKESYSQVTSYVRAAVLAGRTISSAVVQILLHLNWATYRDLNYITIVTLVAASIWSLFLPSIQTSIYFHPNEEKLLHRKEKYSKAFILMKEHFIESFSKQYVVKWSIWWILATCVYKQVLTYSQPLWSVIRINANEQLHNGSVDAISTIIGCFVTLIAGFLRVNWKKWGDLLIVTSSIICGTLLIITSQSQNIISAYICYIAYFCIYQFVITVATAEVSKYIVKDSYGLVFGFNTLIALTLETISILVLITGKVAWELQPREQHIAYGLYYIGIAFIFIILLLFKCIFYRNSVNST